MKIEVGLKLYTSKFIVEIIDEHKNNMLGLRFTCREGREVNYNIVSPNLIRDMITQKEWRLEDEFN